MSIGASLEAFYFLKSKFLNNEQLKE